MKIDYDELLNKYVVWKFEGENTMFELYSSKLKKDCREFIRKQKRESKNGKRNNKRKDIKKA